LIICDKPASIELQ